MGRYREIVYGMLTGLSIWVMDAMLQAGGRDHFGFDTVASEMILSRPPQLLLRVLLLIVSVALGYSLWQSRERERRMRDLQMILKSLQRQIVNPSLLILGYCSNLALREGWPVRLLLCWGERMGDRTQEGVHLKLPLTHQEIAQMIGASRETVSRLLGELRRQQIISLNGSGLLIKDRDALSAKAGH